MNSLSVNGKNWIYKKFNEEQILYLKENFFLDEITAKLLSIRKIENKDINSFLNPSIKNFLPNPNILLDMEKSTLRTIQAIKDKEMIGIFGDYDVDGATSTAVLGRYFGELEGVNPELREKIYENALQNKTSVSKILEKFLKEI